MQTIFNAPDRDALIARTKTLTPADQPQWGKMNVAQMIEHCIRAEEITHGKLKAKRVFLGYLFGKAAMNKMLTDKPMPKSMPTLKELAVAEVDADFETQKQKWISLLGEYQHNDAEYFMHPFCGKMTRDQTGMLVYKHFDHHLRQFGR
jgi:hypothetical protein